MANIKSEHLLNCQSSVEISIPSLPKYDIPLTPPFHLECSPSWHKLTFYTCRHLKNRNCTCILSNVLEGWIPLGSIFKHGDKWISVSIQCEKVFCLAWGFHGFCNKNVSRSSMSCFEKCKSEFSRKIYTCIRELKYGITAWVYGNFIMLWCNQDREVGTAKLTHIHEYLAAYPTRNKLFLQHIIVHIPGTFLPLILYL